MTSDFDRSDHTLYKDCVSLFSLKLIYTKKRKCSVCVYCMCMPTYTVCCLYGTRIINSNKNNSHVMIVSWLTTKVLFILSSAATTCSLARHFTFACIRAVQFFSPILEQRDNVVTVLVGVSLTKVKKHKIYDKSTLTLKL